MGRVYRDRGSRVAVRRRADGLELRVDGSLASFYAPGRSTTGSVWDALVTPLVALPPARRRSVLVLGLGGGSAARLARAFAPRARIVGVEFDAEVLGAARRWLALDALGVEVAHADALRFLERERARFDLVIEDLFVGRGRALHKPPWLLEQGLALARQRIAPGGILASNTLDEHAAVARALGELFPTRVSISVQGYDNRILAAGAALSARDLRRRARSEPLLADALPRLRFRSLASRARAPGPQAPQARTARRRRA
jgi:spermidine synthase